MSSITDKVRDAIGGHIQRVQRKTMLAAVRTATRVTPVVTGRAKGGWDGGVNFQPTAETGILDKSGAATIKRAMAVVEAAPPYVKIYLVNNVEYVKYLDEGTDKFPPFAMTRAVAATIETNKAILARG